MIKPTNGDPNNVKNISNKDINLESIEDLTKKINDLQSGLGNIQNLQTQIKNTPQLKQEIKQNIPINISNLSIIKMFTVVFFIFMIVLALIEYFSANNTLFLFTLLPYIGLMMGMSLFSTIVGLYKNKR